jgi:hypothetical protein
MRIDDRGLVGQAQVKVPGSATGPASLRGGDGRRRGREQRPGARRPFWVPRDKKSGPISGATTKEAKEGCKERRCKGLPREPGKLSADVRNICEGHAIAASFLKGTRCISAAKTKGRNQSPGRVCNPLPNGVLGGNRGNHASPTESGEGHGAMHNPAHSMQAPA